MKKEQDIIKKVCSLLLSLAMVLTMIPVNAFAAEEDQTVTADTAENAVENAVAEVTASDGTVIGQYDSLNAAITAAQDRDASTVTLLADTMVTSQLGDAKMGITKGHYTVDLNGKTVTSTSAYCFYFNDSSVNVTIKNGTLAGEEKASRHVVTVFRAAAVTLENVTATASLYPVCVMGGTVTIYGGECGTAEKKNGIYVGTGTTVKLYGGTYHAIWTHYQENYLDYSSLLPTGYIFMQKDDSGEYTKYIDPSAMGTDTEDKKKNVYDIRVVKCTHSGGLDIDGKCPRCGLAHEHTAPNAQGQCETCQQLVVAQSGDQYYTDLSGAIAAANGAEITLLQVFGENVTVADGADASIRLGNGGTVEGEGTDPCYWMAKDNGIPLTMNGGSITLKDGAMRQGGTESNDNTAVMLTGGTLAVESSVTMIAGGKTTQQQPAIEATGGTLALQGNTHLEGGLCLRGNATLANKLQAGIFTNGVNGSVSVDGHNTYSSVFDLLETGYVFANYNADGTTGAVIAKDNDAKKLTADVAVIACTHKDASGGSLFVKGTCSQCGLTCTKHEFDSETDSCKTCGQKIVAIDGQLYYVSLNEAFAQVEGNREISAVAKLPEELLTFGGNKTVTLNLNNWPVAGKADNAATLTVTGGKLKIINATEGSSAVNNPAAITNNGKGFAVSVTGGKLAFGGKAAIIGGLQVITGGELEGGLKEGSILIKGSGNQIGESLYSVSVRDHANNTNYGTVLDLLAPGCAFAKYDTSKENNAGELVSGNDVSLTEDVIVVAHSAHDMKLDSTSGKYVCACGFVCEHNQGFTDGKCNICGATCTHPEVIESGGMTTCSVCKTQMVVKVEKDGTTTYYAERRNKYNDETLWYLFNNNLESDSTVTLLADDLLAWAFVGQGKQITLNLNGKRLTETFQGITVGQSSKDDTSTSSKLTVTGTGKSETSTEAQYDPHTFRVNDGGTLEFNEDFEEGTFGGIRVENGKLTSIGVRKDIINIGTLEIADSKAQISFEVGNFDKIIYNGPEGGSVKLGDLLDGNRSGYAFRYTTGDKAFVPYDTEITSSHAVENVTITGCQHDSVTDRTCDYCGTKNIAGLYYLFEYGEWVSKGTYCGESSDETDMNQGANDAINGWGNTSGGKLKLFTDATLKDITIKNKYATVIDLNGHKITGGTLTLDNGVNLTITDESEGKNGSFANVTVNAGASLTVDSGISVGRITASDKTAKITLKEGSSFTGYDRVYGMALMDWVEDGYYIKDGDRYESLSAVGSIDTSGTAKTGAYTVTKASATITASNRTGEIEHGAKVSASFLPTITDTNGTTPDYYFIQWYRRTEKDVLSLGDVRLRDGTFSYGGTEPRFEGVNVGDTLDVFCTITAYKSDDKNATYFWQTAVKDYKLTVTKGKAAVETLPTAIAGLSYTGSAQELITDTGKADGGEMQYSLDGTTYSADIPQGTEAKEYTVWYKAVGDSYHDDSEPQRMKVKIAPILLSTTPYSGNDRSTITKGYDGTAQVQVQIDGFVKNGGDLSNADDRIALKQGTDFTVMNARYDNADAGTAKTASMTFVMKNTNYAFASSDPTYTYPYASITKASADGLTKHSGSFIVANHTTATYTYGLSQLLPELPDPCSYGDLSYTARWNAEAGSVYKVTDNDIRIKDGVLTLQIDKDAADADGPMKAGSITVTVSSANYDDFDLTITVDAADLKVPQGEPTMSTNTLTYGDTLSRITLSGTMKDGDTAVKGTFAWGNPDAKVGPVGDYVAAWTFTPADTTKYVKTMGVTTIKVQKATVTGVPNYTPVTMDGQTLADANLTSDAQNGESLFKASGKAVEGSVKWVDSADKSTELDSSAKVEQGKAYTWLFIPTDSTNYNTLTGTITLWPQSTGGGSTGGGGTSTSGGGGGAAAPATPDSDVITEKDSSSGIATKTTIKETKTKTAKNEQGQTVSKTTAAVSKELAEELVKQALDHKSDTVEITVTSTAADAASGSAKSTELEIPKTAIEEIVAKTDADLVIKTDSGEVALDNKTLQTIAKEAKGDTVTITVSENTRLTKAQNAAKDIVGKNGRIFDLAASIGGKLVHDFDGGKAYVTLPMPENIKAKDALVIYIDDNGICQILNHTVETVGADSYIKFTTPHFSTFAVVEKSKAEDLIQAQNIARVKKLIKNAKFKVTTKTTGKKSVKVTVAPKNNKSLISEIQSMGYTVKYRFYRSTKKNSGYKLLKTTKVNGYTNTTGKKGKKYYYKVRVLVYDGKRLIAESELKQASCATKIWTK